VDLLELDKNNNNDNGRKQAPALLKPILPLLYRRPADVESRTMSNSFLRNFPRPPLLEKRTATFTLEPENEQRALLSICEIFSQMRISHLRIHLQSFEDGILAENLDETITNLLLHDQFCLMDLDSYEVRGVTRPNMLLAPLLPEPLLYGFYRSLTVLTLSNLRLPLDAVKALTSEGRNVERMEFDNVMLSVVMTEEEDDSVEFFGPRLRTITFASMERHELVSTLMRCLVDEGTVAVHYTGDAQSYPFSTNGWKALNVVKLSGVGSLHLKDLSISDTSQVWYDIWLHSDLRELCLESVAFENGTHALSIMMESTIAKVVSLRLPCSLNNMGPDELERIFRSIGQGSVQWLDLSAAAPTVATTFATLLPEMNLEVAHLGVVLPEGHQALSVGIRNSIMTGANGNLTLGVVATRERRQTAFAGGIWGLGVTCIDHTGEDTALLTPDDNNKLRDYAERNAAAHKSAVLRSVSSLHSSDGSPRPRNEEDDGADETRLVNDDNWETPNSGVRKRQRN